MCSLQQTAAISYHFYQLCNTVIQNVNICINKKKSTILWKFSLLTEDQQEEQENKVQIFKAKQRTPK